MSEIGGLRVLSLKPLFFSHSMEENYKGPGNADTYL